MTTIDTLTIHQILTLRQESAQAGDFEMAAICTRAISGHQGAAAAVVEAIRLEESRADEDQALDRR
jgi:hypothetical protein